jgi:hypothetical protein
MRRLDKTNKHTNRHCAVQQLIHIHSVAKYGRRPRRQIPGELRRTHLAGALKPICDDDDEQEKKVVVEKY